VRQTPASLLTSLFVLNRAVPAGWPDALLPSELIDLLYGLSLVVRTGDGECRGSVSLTPYRDRWFLSDQLFLTLGPQRVVQAPGDDLVMPPHASSLLVLDGMRELEGSVLDAGCGSGFLALNAGPKTGRVAGFDLNPRCVAFAAANSALNSADAAFTVGDLADFSLPLDDRFDHLIFNAPTTPRIDGAEAEVGQSTMESMLHVAAAAVPRLLRPGGTAAIFGLVEVPERLADAEQAVREWLAGESVTDITVTVHDSPLLSVSRRQLRQGRLHGQSLLVYGSGQACHLLDALASRGTAAIDVVTVSFRAVPFSAEGQ
jgi:SAM-dependent methyltransferase